MDDIIDISSDDDMTLTKKRKGRGSQKTLKWNVKFLFDSKILINEDFTTLSHISDKFGVSYNTLRSLSCGRCKKKNPIFKNIVLTKLN